MDENYQANNVLGLNDNYQSNNVTAIQNNLQNNNVINAPELNAKMQQAREEALSSNLAGEPYVPQLLTTPEKPVDLSDTQITSGFTTRDQIMAKAGLMDDKGNYTDTYTNYISKGGSPLPGYEYAHQELLNQERYDRIFQKYQDGEMSYDTALMEAYGNDILAANFGIDLTSVAYWKNKFLSDDYSNPFANQYLMDQVKNIAQQYHTARQTGDWAHQNIADTQLSNLVGTEIDDLGYKKISDLFPNLQGLSKDLKEDDFLKALHTGQLDAQMRMTKSDDGTWYYLHTDGKLYVLDGKGGDGHGTLHTDAKGELESIDLNNNDIAIGLRGATSGFASVFTGIVDLGAMLLQSANELVPISAIFGDENLGIWDGVDDKDSIFSWANSFDSFMQDDYAWLVDDGYVDLSGNISGRDVWNFVGTFTGQIAGTMTLSWGMDKLAKGAQALNAAGHPILGKTLQGVSTGLKWQTGNIGSYSDAALKGSAAIWGRRLGAAGVANAKNFLNDTRKLTLQASLYEDGASNSEILMRTFQTSFLNFVIDSAISGGMDDNQVQAYESFFTRNQDVVKNELGQRVTNGAFKKFLTNKSMVIGINSFGDLMGNLITGGVSSMNSIDNKTGKLADWDWASIGKATFSLENVERSVINTLWYSTRSQIKDWNAGLDSIGAAHDNILNKLEEEIRNNRKNPANQETLTKVRDNYLQTIKDSKAQTYEGQILEGMNKLCDELGEKGVPNLIKESFKPAVNERMVARAQELYDIAMISYDKLQTKISNAADPTNRESVGLFKKIVHPIQTLKNGKGVGKTVGKWLIGQSGAEANFREENDKTTKFNKTLSELSKVIISEQELDDIQANWDIVGDKKGALETSSAYQIKKKNKETYNQLCKVLGKEVVDNGMFYYIPQEASNTAETQSDKMALKIMSDLGYVVKIDGTNVDNMYMFKPYMDQIDFVNGSTMNKLIHSSISAIAATEDSDIKQQIFTRLGKDLFDSNASDAQKAMVLSSVLNSLTKNIGANGKALLDTDEAGLIFLSLQEQGVIKHNLTIKDTKNLTNVEAYKYMSELADVMLKLQKEKASTLDLADPMTMKVLKELEKQPKYKEAINKLLKLQEENPAAFQNGSMFNKQKFILSELDKKFNKLNIKNQSNESDVLPKLASYLSDGHDNVEDITKYLISNGYTKQEAMSFRDSKDFQDILKFAESFDKVYANAKTVTIDNGNDVYIDLEKFQGNVTTKFLNKILSEGKSSLRNINDVKQYAEYESDLYNELVARNSAVLQNGSLIHFDLSTDINEFKTFMKGYGYDISGNDASSIKKNLQDIKGLKNFRGDTLVLNIPRVNNVENLREALLQSSIDIGDKNISLREINTVKFKDKQIQKADVDRAIMDLITIKNIDPRIQVALKNAPLLNVVPFEQPVTGEKYNYTMPIASALFGGTENLRKQSGKIAGMTGKDLEYIMTKSAGAPVDYNTDLETYFILDQIVTRITDNKNHTISTIHVSQSEIDFLKENNLIAYKEFGTKGYKNEDSIWRLNDKNLVLNKDFTKDELMNYVVSKDFNLRKLIPFTLTDVPEDERGRQGIIDAFTTTSTEGLQESIPGLNRNTGLQLLNIRLAWDDGNNSRYAMFLRKLMDNKDVVYNPLKDADFVRNTKENTEWDTFDEWYAHAEKSKDPYDILAKLYVDSYNDMIHQNSNTNGSYDNWTILAATPRIRLILLEELEKGNTQASAELISKIKKVLPFKQREKYGVTNKTINVPGGYVGKAAEPDKAYVSEQRIGYAAGGPENYDIRADIEWVDLDTVQKAMDTLNEIRTNVDNEYARSYYSTYDVPMYKENNALKLLKGAVGNDGYIPIADADEMLRLFADVTVDDNGKLQSYAIRNDMTDVLKLMWGDNYSKACDEIFAQAKRFNILKQQRETTFAHGFVTGQGPSLEKSAISGTYDYIPHITDEGVELSEKEHNNLDEFTKYINNSLKNDQLNGDEEFKYITDTSKDLLNNELIDRVTNKMMEDRNLYTSAPYTTDVEEYAYAHNFIGQMKSTVATYNELKQLFPDQKDDQALMNTATTLVNLHRGVDYVGETTNFVIVKNGELINADKNYMESFGSANYEDLLLNIQEAKNDIIGATLLKINSQSADNVAGLQMSYRKIETDADYSDLITDLYRNFVIENAYYLGNSGKVSVDELEQEIFGRKINPDKVQKMLNNVPAENISQLQKYNRMYDTFREQTGALNFSKQEFMATLKAVDTIANLDMARNAIANSLGDESKANKTVTQTIKNLVYAMGNPDSMPDEKRKLIKDFKSTLNDFCLEEYKNEELTPQQQVEQLIFKNLIEKEDAATYDLLMRNRSLKEMQEEIRSGNIKNGFAINKDNRVVNRVDADVLNKLKDAIEADDASLSDIKVIVSGDTETGLVDDALDSNTSVFNLGLKVRRANAEGKYDTTTYNIFVNYEGENLTPEERRQFRERWVQRNIMDAKDKRSIEFREENEGYKGTYEKYLDIDKYINTEGSEQTLYLRPSEIKQFINDLYGKEKGVFIGYNSSGADIPWMIKGGLIDDDFTNKVMHLDVKVLGDTSLAIYTSGKKDIRARDFGLNLMDAHEGLSDAKITEDLLLKTIDTTYNIVNIRDSKYKEIEKLIEDSGLKISKGQLNEIINKVDNKLKEVRGTFDNLDQYFDVNKEMTTDTVAAAKYAFEYMANKRLCNMKYALYERMIEDNYLSSKAIKALDENKQDIVNRLWSFASSKGKTKEDLGWAIFNEVKLSGNDMNSLLETLGSEARISRIIDRLQLDEKEFNNYTDSKVFTPINPKDDSEFNSEYFEALNKQRTTRQFLDTFKGITNSMRFSNDSEMRDFVNGLGKIYSFREGLDPKELLKDDIHLINTKITQQYKEYLYNHYGDTDAVMAQSRKGLYDLVDAVPVGVQINIGSKEKPNYITSDSSMIVLSKEQFRNLMGRDYNPETDTELYSQLLIHPADGNNKILPRKIVVDTELKGRYMKVPETLIETLGSRDFDGDHLTLLKPEDYSQEVLKIYTNNMYKIHDTQEKVLSFLRQKGVGYKNYKEDNFITNGIGKDERVLELCREANEALENNNENKIKELTTEFEKYINSKEEYKQYKLDDIKDALWITDKDLYIDTGNIETIRYINNPALYFSDAKRKVMLNGKEIEVGLTYSGEQRLKAETSQLTNKYLYNFIDQTTGITQKYAINKLKNAEINNPWTDLLASGIYGSDTVYKYFKNIGSLSNEDLDDFGNLLIESLTDSYKNSGYWTYINKGNRIEKQAKGIVDQIKTGNINAAFDSYDSLLRTTEEIQREHMKPGELMKALTSEQMQAHYENLNARIAKVQKNINLYNDLAKHSIYFPSDNDYGEATEFTLNSAINKLATQYADQYNQDIWEKGPALNAFIITRFGEGPEARGEKYNTETLETAYAKDQKTLKLLQDTLASKQRLLDTGKSQRPGVEDKTIDLDIVYDQEGNTLRYLVQRDISSLSNKIKSLQAFIDKDLYHSHDMTYEKLTKNKDYIRLHDTGMINGIGEDTILINNNVPFNKKLVGYSRVVYDLDKNQKLSPDIQLNKFYKAGTKLNIGGDTLTLNKMSYIAGISPKKIVVAQVDYLDNNYKMTTNIGGKGVVNSSYTTDEDYQILLNKPDLSKLPTSYTKHINTEEKPIVIYGPNGEAITAYGYAVPNVKALVTEDTAAWTKSKDRKIDALHVVMDSNTINGVLDMGAKFEDGKLTTNPEAYKDLRNSVYKTYNDIQTTNFLGQYNKTKIAYIINRISDEELQQAFHTELDPVELRHRLLNNMYLATDKYTSIAYTLGKKFQDRIDDDLGRRLFSQEGLSIIGDFKRSRLTDANIYAETSKNDVASQASLNSDGTSNMSVFKARTIHLSPDEMNLGKGYDNKEDYYVSPFDYFRLLTAGQSDLNSFNVKELIKEGSLPYGTFMPDTANMENGWRHFQSEYTVKDAELQKFIPQGQSSKTATQAEKANIIGANPIEVDLSEPTKSEVNYDISNEFSDEIINMLKDIDGDSKSGYAKTVNMLRQLQMLDRNASSKDKQAELNNSKKLYDIFDSHLSVDYDDEGNPDVKLSKNIKLTGTLQDLYNKTKNSVYNYATYNMFNDSTKEKKTLNAKVLDENIDKTKFRKSKDNYKKQVDKLWVDLQNDFYDSKTGEVKSVDPKDFSTPSDIQPARILEGGEESVLEKSVWGRQGLKENTKLGAELTIAMKSTKAGAAFLEQEYMRDLNAFESIAKQQMSDSEIKDFAHVQALVHGAKNNVDKERIELGIKQYGFKDMQEVIDRYKDYQTYYPRVVDAFNTHVKNLYQLNKDIAAETGEPLGICIMAEISPYKSTNKSYNNAKARAIISNALGLQRYDPTFKGNSQAETLEFDIWNSSKSIIKELSNMHAANIMKKSLISQNLLKNDSLLDNVSKLLDKNVETVKENLYVKQDDDQQKIQDVIFDTITDLTGMHIKKSSFKYTFKQYKDLYKEVDERAKGLLQNFYDKYPGYTDKKSYSDFMKIVNSDSINTELKESAKAVSNYYYAKMLIGQAMIQSSPEFANSMGEYIAGLKDSGYSLVNAYGQKYVKGGVVKPLSSSSMSNLIENMEISYNSASETQWNQFVLEKIIAGDVYLLRNDIADHIESHIYTQEIPSNTMKTLSTIGKWSTAIQMALPSKILNRVISFTGFDYSMALTYDPTCFKYFGPARRELLAAFQSNGTNISDDLKGYLEREGQPIGLTGKDPITFSEELNGPENVMRVLNKLTDPLEFQNHLGRYAIYLAAKKSFDDGNPNYGPMYYAKDAIDALGEGRNEDKAMMIMDYILGSPGGFPELSKKTKGLMLYTTFPMNFARTLGAYGMSLGKLFSEGFNGDNAKYWMKSAAVPSMALAGITGMSMLITSWICDLFGIEEDEKEKLVKDLGTLDPVGTLISGSPQKSSSSMNPVSNFNEMFIEPFTNPRNKSIFEKVFGLVNTNILSHINPAMKIPVEVMTGYDVYGSSLMNTKYQYNNIENGMRKVLGSVLGSNIGTELVMQHKIDKYSTNDNELGTLLTGVRRGVASSLGNEKTYKKDTTNYYNRINSVRNYKYKLSGGSYSDDVEDYVNAESMERIRNYKSRYGSYNEQNYKEMNSMLTKMMKNKEEPATVYAYIISKYNDGVDESTIKAVLNNHSIIRRLNSLKENKGAYLASLSSEEYKNLLKAIQYENTYYPILQKLFPEKQEDYYKKASYKKYYPKSSYGGGYSSPRSYTPRAPQVYPSSGYSNNKYKTYRPQASIKKVAVEVSPQMGVWTNDYNKVVDLQHWKDQNYNRVKPMNHGGGK